jgi:hypothetical protein
MVSAALDMPTPFRKSNARFRAVPWRAHISAGSFFGHWWWGISPARNTDKLLILHNIIAVTENLSGTASHRF